MKIVKIDCDKYDDNRLKFTEYVMTKREEVNHNILYITDPKTHTLIFYNLTIGNIIYDRCYEIID